MIVVCILLTTMYLSIIIAARIGFLRRLRKSKRESQLKPVSEGIACSIVVPARNEEKNILNCLNSLKNQKKIDGISYEVILINDFSEDQTGQIAETFFKENPIGYVLHLSEILSPDERLNSYKKRALDIAISRAKYPWIVQADADCEVPEYWLSTLFSSEGALQQNQFIAGPVCLEPTQKAPTNSLLYQFQSLDFMTMQAITAATHQFQIGAMCNGANLAFRKSAFDAVDGYQGIDGIASGDDMLLLHKILEKFPNSSQYVAHPDAIVRTAVQETWSDFLNQRIRWSSKGGKYGDKRLTAVLAVVYLFNLMLLTLPLLSFFNPKYLHLIGVILALKIVFEWCLLIPAAYFFKKQKLIFIFPFLQPMHILYIVVAGFFGMFGTYQWKGRKVR